MPQFFHKVVAGPSSYPPGGFVAQVGEFQKIETTPMVTMVPSDLLGTSAIAGFEPIINPSTPNAVRIRVLEAWWSDPSRAWAEVSSGTDLSAGHFILTGKAI